MSPLRAHTLGDLRLAREAGEPVALRRKPLALLVYLARRSPRSTPRPELAELLWGDRSGDRARQSLRQALAEVRQVVGDALEVSADGVRLAEDAVVLDLVEFEADVRGGRDEAAAERWTGDFFPAAGEIADGFERWVEGERAAAHRRLGVVMERLVGAAERRADWSAAVAWAERWAAALPHDERAHARLVEVLRTQGRAEDALERHADFVTRLRGALDLEPSPEFLRLAGPLREQAQSEAAQRVRPSTAVRTPALVGRGHEMLELTAAWETARDGLPAVVLVEGVGGSGKSRLCDEIAKLPEAAGRDALVLRARGLAADGEPYATARELFAALRDAPGLAGASPEALAELARVVPSLADAFPRLPAPAGTDAALRDAVVQTLEAVSEELPVLVVVDDVHEADAATRLLLAVVAGMLSGGVALVFVASFGAREPRLALDILLAVPGLRRLMLRPLTVREVEAMLDSMLALPDRDRARLAARLHAETLGGPFLVYELVVALIDDRLLTVGPSGEWRVSASGEDRPLPLPVAIRDRLAAAFAPLSPAARTLLDAASVVGMPAAGGVIQSVAGQPRDDAAHALAELVRRNMLREVLHHGVEAGAHEGTATGAFDFTHPIVGRVAYALLPPSERTALHARAAAELATRELTTTTERRILPYHLARAGTPRVPAPAVATRRGSWRRIVPRSRRHLVTAFAALLTLTLAFTAVRRATGSGGTVEASAAPSRRVMLGTFENRSGRADLDRTRDRAVDRIVRGLDETGLVEIVGARPAPAGAQRSGTALAADERARAAAREARAGTLITGAVDQHGDTIVLEAVLVDARDGSLLRSLPPVRASAAEPLPGVDRLGREVVGAVAALVDPTYDAGGSVRPPANYEAYLAFVRGEEADARGASARAVDEYRRAATADTTFTLPLLRLAFTAFHTGRCERVDSVDAVLRARGAQLSRYEGHYLDRARAFCRGDWEAANAAARRMADLTPRSQHAQFAAALSALSVNRPNEARRRLRAIDPARGWVPPEGRYWVALALAHHMAGDDAGLRALADRVDREQRDYFTVVSAAYAAAALGDTARLARAADELLATGRHMAAPRRLILVTLLDELRVHAGAGAAARLSARLAEQVAGAAPAGAAGDTARLAQAELLYRAGRWGESRALAVPLARRGVLPPFALALAGRVAARMGDRAGAERALRALDGPGTPALRGASSYGQAQISALLGRTGDAVRLLHRAALEGLTYTPDVGTAYLGHADVDLAPVLADPATRSLLRRRD